MVKEFHLLKSEIKKAVKKANELNGCKDCTVTGYFHSGVDELGFVTVTCEICHNYEERADHDVVLECFMADRRSSWAHECFG